MAFSREALLTAARTAQIQREEVQIPELGGSVFVRGMSGTERDKFEEGMRIRNGKRAGQSDLRNFRARLAVKVIVDADGKRLLNDSDEDIALIGRLPSGVLDRVISKCQELSGQTQPEVEALGEDSASEAASADSASNSPSN